MLNANELLQEGIKLVESIGIKPGKINPEVVVNKRAINRFGLCTKKYNDGYDYIIEINYRLLEGNKESAMETMIHEILHTCKGCMNHGKTWTAYANKVTRELGYKITRTSTFESKSLERPKAKYIIACKECDVKYMRHRKSKVVTHYKRYRCGSCSGELELLK